MVYNSEGVCVSSPAPPGGGGWVGWLVSGFMTGVGGVGESGEPVHP